MKILIISIHAVYAYNEKHGTDIAPSEHLIRVIKKGGR